MLPSHARASEGNREPFCSLLVDLSGGFSIPVPSPCSVVDSYGLCTSYELLLPVVNIAVVFFHRSDGAASGRSTRRERRRRRREESEIEPKKASSEELF